MYDDCDDRDLDTMKDAAEILYDLVPDQSLKTNLEILIGEVMEEQQKRFFRDLARR